MNNSLVSDNSPDTCCNDQTPKGIETQTQLTPDMLPVDEPQDASVHDAPTEEELIESVVEINPDVNSMDSRG